MSKCADCMERAEWMWREYEAETPYCQVCFVRALLLLVESRDGQAEWVSPRTISKGAHCGSELLGMLTVIS